MSSHASYSLRVIRLRLLDTAEAQDAWETRARKQWDGASSVTLRVMCGGSVVGMTPPRGIQWDAAPGLVWNRVVGSERDPSLFDHLPLEEDPSVLIEVVSLARPPGHIVAMGTWNATSFVAGGGHHMRMMLHLYPKVSVADPVYAVVEIEVTRSALEPPSVGAHHALTSSAWAKQEIPLEFTCGPIRASLTDLYFPPFLVDCNGSYVVSNVICVANMLEEGTLSMVLVAKGNSSAVKFHPPNGVAVSPGQRAYFSVTWSMGQVPEASISHEVHEVELLVSGGTKAHPTVQFRVHMGIPRDEAVLAPFHYWVNTTCVTNRPVHAANELPFVRSVLPVFLFHRQAAMINDALMGTNTEDEEADLMITDKDTGLRRYVAGGMAGPAALAAGSPVFHRASLPYVPPTDFTDRVCVGTLTLGKVVGVPILYTSSINGSSGVAPAFKLTAQMLDPRWSFVEGGDNRAGVAETSFVYQSVSGVLQWPTAFPIFKAAGASPDQFMRITLVEVSPMDDDEMPVAACILTLPSLTANEGRSIPICTAFYVLDSYSLYDQLPSISLPLKGASLVLQSQAASPPPHR